MVEMEDLYKQALRRLKQGQPLNPVYDVDWLYQGVSSASSEGDIQSSDNLDMAEAVRNDDQHQITEKTKILDSFYQFGDKKLEGKQQFVFPGGELTKKNSQPEFFCTEEIEGQFSEAEIWENSFSPHQKQQLMERFKRLEQCHVLFVTDQVEGDGESYLESFFKPHVAQLFSKMVQAMGMGDNWMLTALAERSKKQVGQEILLLKPSFVICLGASATQFILSTEKRLKNIHGEVLELKLNKDFSFKVMPLFSPKLLSTAPNMKKTAWTDMQKVMRELNLF